MAEVLRFFAEDGEEFVTENSAALIEAFRRGDAQFILDDGRVLTGKLIDTESMN